MSGDNTDERPDEELTSVEFYDRMDRDYGTQYYDRQGNPMPGREWAKSFENPDSKRVAETTIGDWWISTVWLGLDHGFRFEVAGGEQYRPVIFETMIFYRPQGRPIGLSGGMDNWNEQIAAHNAELETLHPELQELDQTCQRYHTEEEALAGHDKTCVDLRVLLANIAMAEEVATEAIKAPSVLSQPKEEGL